MYLAYSSVLLLLLQINNESIFGGYNNYWQAIFSDIYVIITKHYLCEHNRRLFYRTKKLYFITVRLKCYSDLNVQ